MKLSGILVCVFLTVSFQYVYRFPDLTYLSRNLYPIILSPANTSRLAWILDLIFIQPKITLNICTDFKLIMVSVVLLHLECIAYIIYYALLYPNILYPAGCNLFIHPLHYQINQSNLQTRLATFLVTIKLPFE